MKAHPKNHSKVCCIFNLAPLYRAPIYTLMDQQLKCDFYFGSDPKSTIALMDYENLKGYKKTTKIVQIPKTGFHWQLGVWSLIFKDYKHYILTGSPGSLSNWVLLILAKVLGKRTYAWTHGMKGNESKFGNLIQKSFYKLCHRIFLYGEYSKSNMEKKGFNSSKLIPIYNSLDYDTQKPLRGNTGNHEVYNTHFRNQDPVLLYIGRIQRVKKIDFLLKAQKQLLDQGCPCNLILIGPEDDDTSIPNLVKELGLDKRVWFYGPCYEERQISTLISQAALCVSPGPIGLTALHAMSYGTPIITHDDFNTQMPEFEVIIKNETGNFFKKDSLESLVNTIQQWLHTPPLSREALRKKAYAVIDERYNPHYQIKTISNTIKAAE